MKKHRSALKWLLLLVLSGWTLLCLSAAERPATAFFGWTNLSGFKLERASAPGSWVLESPVIWPELEWNELIVSWNGAPGAWQADLQARPLWRGQLPGGYYNLGHWDGLSVFNRYSITNQADVVGLVDTDTLKLKTNAVGFQLRVVLSGSTNPLQVLKFLSVSLAQGTALARVSTNLPVGLALTALEVPQKSQLSYPGGEQLWCSPTCGSMLLNYWANRLKRDDLRIDVPEVARQVNDPNWPGTGNWPFNTAYAGSFPGMRGYVARLESLEAVREWVKLGVPVALSVSNNRLKGKNIGGSGHLIVCVGFEANGDVIVNDPGTRGPIRKAFARSLVEQAWAESHHTVYLIHPMDWPVPKGEW